MNNQEWFNESLLSTSTENFVEVEGAKIHCLSWGDTNKPGLFFIHVLAPMLIGGILLLQPFLKIIVLLQLIYQDQVIVIIESLILKKSTQKKLNRYVMP